jgi:hypothetical protein
MIEHGISICTEVKRHSGMMITKKITASINAKMDSPLIIVNILAIFPVAP